MKNIEAILSTYDELYNRTNGDGAVLSVLTLATIISQQTEIIKILCSNVKHLDSTLSNIERYAADDLDGRLEDIADNIHGVKSMMLDTLGSAKSGDALDALAKLPDAIREAAEDDDWLNDPEWLKEGRYIILDHKPTAEDFVHFKEGYHG